MKLVNIVKLINSICSPSAITINIITDHADVNDSFVGCISGQPKEVINRSAKIVGNYCITDLYTVTDNDDGIFIPYPGFMKLYVEVKEDYSIAGYITDKKMDEDQPSWSLTVYDLLVAFRNLMETQIKIKGNFEGDGFLFFEFTGIEEIISAGIEFFDFKVRYVIPPKGYFDYLVILCDVSKDKLTGEQIIEVYKEFVENSQGVFDDIPLDKDIF